MTLFLLAVMGVGLALSCHAQVVSSGATSDLATILSFEMEHAGGSPQGWGGGPAGTIFVDDAIVHGGRWSVRIDRNVDSPGAFSTITNSLPMDFSGTTIRLQGFVRTENVSEFVGLWMREDGDSPAVAFDNMQQRQVKGTTDWTEYSISLPVHAQAKQLFFGFLVAGTGKGWVDDLQLLVDDKPIWEAPKAERPKTVLDRDQQLDDGSGIVLKELTQAQIENLAVLGKVWGFLKYHHSSITSGQRHWDFELLRVLPTILAAGDGTAANAALDNWIAALGVVEHCNPCAKLDGELHLQPEMDWIANQSLLGADLSRNLREIHRNRPDGGGQFYVSLTPGVGNPVFENEPSYQSVRLPDAGFQILALYRFWNIVQYWFPYRDVIGEDWDKVLADFLPRIALAKDSDAYQLELMALIARANDTHANLWSSLDVRPPVGDCQLPVIVRWIEDLPVIAGYSQAATGAATGLRAGDVVEALDGTPVPELIQRWKPYYAASNEVTRLRDIGWSMTRGDRVEARVRVRRSSETLELTARRIPVAEVNLGVERTHDLPGETFRLLSREVAYLKLSSVKAAEAARYVDDAAGTKGLIIDIRNYPSEFVVFALGSLLVEKETEFVRFTTADLANPGAFHWANVLSLSPQKPHYPGKVVILVDETTLSQAEYTSMALRASPQVVVVGSTTAGADGNVSQIPLPGGLRSMVSGIGIFYPDKRPTQRVGIVPDIEKRPTIAGIAAGRDEVLEEALRQIQGPRFRPHRSRR